MRKISILIVISVLFISMTPITVSASEKFLWGNDGNYVSCNGSFGTSGNSYETKVFFVDSDGNAKITFEQEKGISEYSPFGIVTTIGDNCTEDAWGKYEITVCDENGKKIYYHWNDTYLNGSFTIKLNKVGYYYIVVRPYTSDEMTDSYRYDDFIRWSTPANWWIDSKKNCTISTSTPFTSSSSSASSSAVQQSQPEYADVQIIHWSSSSSGKVILYEITTKLPTGYQVITPYWSSSNYELSGDSSVYYNVKYGKTNAVYFHYKEVRNSGSSASNNSSQKNDNYIASSSGNTSNNNGSNQTSFNPDSPFLYGRQEYNYCEAPEYMVDPTQKPWNYCYLYDKPSDINGSNMGRYEKGEVVKVIKYHGGNHGKFNYCYVITKDNKLGYMHDYALKPVEYSQEYYENLYYGW